MTAGRRLTGSSHVVWIMGLAVAAVVLASSQPKSGRPSNTTRSDGSGSRTQSGRPTADSSGRRMTQASVIRSGSSRSTTTKTPSGGSTRRPAVPKKASARAQSAKTPTPSTPNEAAVAAARAASRPKMSPGTEPSATADFDAEWRGVRQLEKHREIFRVEALLRRLVAVCERARLAGAIDPRNWDVRDPPGEGGAGASEPRGSNVRDNLAYYGEQIQQSVMRVRTPRAMSAALKARPQSELGAAADLLLVHHLIDGLRRWATRQYVLLEAFERRHGAADAVERRVFTKTRKYFDDVNRLYAEHVAPLDAAHLVKCIDMDMPTKWFSLPEMRYDYLQTPDWLARMAAKYATASAEIGDAARAAAKAAASRAPSRTSAQELEDHRLVELIFARVFSASYAATERFLRDCEASPRCMERVMRALFRRADAGVGAAGSAPALAAIRNRDAARQHTAATKAHRKSTVSPITRRKSVLINAAKAADAQNSTKSMTLHSSDSNATPTPPPSSTSSSGTDKPKSPPSTRVPQATPSTCTAPTSTKVQRPPGYVSEASKDSSKSSVMSTMEEWWLPGSDKPAQKLSDSNFTVGEISSHDSFSNSPEIKITLPRSSDSTNDSNDSNKSTNKFVNGNGEAASKVDNWRKALAAEGDALTVDAEMSHCDALVDDAAAGDEAMSLCADAGEPEPYLLESKPQPGSGKDSSSINSGFSQIKPTSYGASAGSTQPSRPNPEAQSQPDNTDAAATKPPTPPIPSPAAKRVCLDVVASVDEVNSAAQLRRSTNNLGQAIDVVRSQLDITREALSRLSALEAELHSYRSNIDAIEHTANENASLSADDNFAAASNSPGNPAGQSGANRDLGDDAGPGDSASGKSKKKNKIMCALKRWTVKATILVNGLKSNSKKTSQPQPRPQAEQPQSGPPQSDSPHSDRRSSKTKNETPKSRAKKSIRNKLRKSSRSSKRSNA